MVDLGERADTRHAEHLVAVRGPNDDVVSLGEQVAHDAVARTVRPGRGADERDRPCAAEDLGRAAHPPKAILGAVVKAVLFDVDFTLARPGPSSDRRATARSASGTGSRSTRRSTRRRGGRRSTRSSAIPTTSTTTSSGSSSRSRSSAAWAAPLAHGRAEELVRAWEQHERFTLYEDALPVLAALREHGVKIGFVSNGSRDLEEFVTHHGLDADCAIGSRLRPHQAAPRDLPPRARVARRRAGGGGDDRRPVRGRHRGGPRARDEGVPARPRRPLPDEPDRLPDLARSRPRSDWRPGRVSRSRTIRTCAASARAAWRRSR